MPKTRRPFDLKKYLVNVLRKASYRYPARGEALKNARVERNTYVCNFCKKTFTRQEVQLDHKDPVVDPSRGFLNFAVFIDRLFVEASGLQVLCVPCHKERTRQQREIRKMSKPKIKAKKR